MRGVGSFVVLGLVILFGLCFARTAATQSSRMMVLNPDVPFVSGFQTEWFSTAEAYARAAQNEEKPQLLWERTFGGSDSDFVGEMIECSDGGFAIAGSTIQNGRSDLDAWLVRTDADGNRLWDQTYGGSEGDGGESLVELDDGGFALLGFTHSYSATPDWWDDDLYLIRTDSAGVLLWNRTYGSTGWEAPGTVLRVGTGFLLVGSQVLPGLETEDLYLIRLDATGNVLWTRTYGGSEVDWCSDGVNLGSQGFLFVGGTQSFGTFPEVWLVRTDANGILMWAKHHTMSSYADSYAAALVPSAGGTFTIVGSAIVQYSVPDILLMQVDANGNLLWNHTYGTFYSFDAGSDLVTCSAGGFALVGSRQNDITLLRTDETGTALWNLTLGSIYTDGCTSLIECGTGGFAIAGTTDRNSPGRNDLWLVRVGQPSLVPRFPAEAVVIAVVVIGGGGTAAGVFLLKRRKHA